MDAPWHCQSTMDGGDPAWTIDQAPLDWCFSAGVKLDFRDFEDGYVATAADVAAELARMDYRLQPLDIVVVNTSAGNPKQALVHYSQLPGPDASKFPNKNSN